MNDLTTNWPRVPNPVPPLRVRYGFTTAVIQAYSRTEADLLDEAVYRRPGGWVTNGIKFKVIESFGQKIPKGTFCGCMPVPHTFDLWTPWVDNAPCPCPDPPPPCPTGEIAKCQDGEWVCVPDEPPTLPGGGDPEPTPTMPGGGGGGTLPPSEPPPGGGVAPESVMSALFSPSQPTDSGASLFPNYPGGPEPEDSDPNNFI